MKPPRIYLAGKVAGPKWELARAWQALFPEAVTFTASDGEKHSEHLWGAGLTLLGEAVAANKSAVQELFVENLRDCDALIAYIDRTDCYGTIAEVVWAASQGVPTALIMHEPRELELIDKFKDTYWFAAALPGVSLQCVHNLGQARKAFVTYIADIVRHGATATLTGKKRYQWRLRKTSPRI